MAAKNAVPGTSAEDRDAVHRQVAVDAIGAGPDPQGRMPVAGSCDGGGKGSRAFLPAGGIGTEGGNAQRSGGTDKRRRDLLEVGKVDDVPGGSILRSDCQANLAASRESAAKQHPRLVEHVVATTVGWPVGEGVAAVEPAVAGCHRKRRQPLASDIDTERGVQARAVRQIRNRVADGDRVRRPGERELDILAPAVEPHRAAARGLRGDGIERSRRADLRPHVAAALRFVFGEAYSRAAAMELRHRHCSNRRRGGGGESSGGEAGGNRHCQCLHSVRCKEKGPELPPALRLVELRRLSGGCP